MLDYFKKFTQFFGGKYMPFWYAAAAIILAVTGFATINDASVKNYKLIVYNADGSVKSEEVVDKTAVSRVINGYDNIGASKKFIPIKPFLNR